MAKLQDTAAIEEFMRAFGQTVRDTPTENITAEERLLRGRLVIEEAFELAQALGLKIALRDGEEVHRVEPKKMIVEIDENYDIDLIEVADAFADIIVVTKGGALTTGIDVDKILLDEVMPSNMAKLGPDGKPIIREGDGKVLKPEGWKAPDVAKVLTEDGWKK